MSENPEIEVVGGSPARPGAAARIRAELRQ
jgi:hypothetical protein